MENMTVCGKSYQVEKLLGHGKGGYSYLVRDEAGRAYVLKQIHHEPCDYYQFGDKMASELGDYEKLSAIGIPMPPCWKPTGRRSGFSKSISTALRFWSW